jgi:hypothetical protein
MFHSVVEKRHRLQIADLEGLAAADIHAGKFFVASHHVGLRLGEFGTVTLVSPTGQLRTLATHNPCNLVLARLPALGASQHMGALFGRFIEKIAFFHGLPALHPSNKNSLPEYWAFHPVDKKPSLGIPGFPSGKTSFILILAMTKRKPGKFSAVKAVKANARERVGQPKPEHVILTEPRTGRAAKHKPKLEEIIRQAES